ncbi:MAG: hypothetical protein M9887_03965 [Chitinophagales bacterium]|nr:hypothetical protein [Chitinophagales bacterium]
MSDIALEIEYDSKKYEQIRNDLEKRFGKKPDLVTITYLIGHRELGFNRTFFTKGEKEELMHIGVCTLLSQRGYYTFIKKDEDGWPHFEKSPDMPRFAPEAQDALLKAMIIEYFEKL